MSEDNMDMKEHNQHAVIPSDEHAAGDDGNITREGGGQLYNIGEWYWVKSERDDDEWLGCVVDIGSNYVKVQEPVDQRSGYRSVKVHFDDAQEELRYEPNAASVIAGYVKHYQQLANQHITEIREITNRLGLNTGISMLDGPARKTETGTALTAAVGADEINAFKNSLLKAKDEDLPALFEKVKKANQNLAKWMSAEATALGAFVNEMKDSLKSVNEKIYNVSLYAGLNESLVTCQDGKPADYHEKLHVMQRRLYMDEECLLDYKTGGMEFKDIEEFDRWLCEPQNFERILPFPRTIVAMQVRRKKKNRYATSNYEAYVNFHMAQMDKLTFLYIRNGEQLHRLSTDIDFGEMTFPDKSVYDPMQNLYAHRFAGSVDEIITEAEYEAMVEQYNKQEEWENANPRKEWEEKNPGKSYYSANPYGYSHNFDPDSWVRFDESTVHFDKIAEYVSDIYKKYNRIALIVQGLFDRSAVLHPHPTIRTWSPDSFASLITLVYDASTALVHGEPPDIKAYIEKCNASFRTGSVSVGQELFWMEREAKRENSRLRANFREVDRFHEIYRPYGNPGPGYVATIESWNGKRKTATFKWQRERMRYSPYESPHVAATITVPGDLLFNVDAYQLGDYKQFFQDPRTREQYLEWAPMLLAAEEYKRGQMELG